ncbi:MAG: FAD-dependent oxidoreductase [Rhodobacteraceae bacterium]|nr:FAD-dependent oxidoreductase [Paracoccaceae bacterium]
MPPTIIIGSGITGLTCAHILARAGQAMRVLDKGRDIGGRMATKRADAAGLALSYDHGAQYLRPRDTDFGAFLARHGAVSWSDADPLHLVGQPGMSALPRAIAKGLDVAQGVEVLGLRHAQGLWHLETNLGPLQAQRVVLTIPAPQALRLLGPDHPLAPELERVRMAPCLTLMASFPTGSPTPFTTWRDADHPLAWIAQDNSKPGRPDDVITWIAQASPDYSAAHLEDTPDTILSKMLPLLCTVLGTPPEQALHAQVHRWRYAQAVQPLGRPFLHAPQLYIGGDWCLGPRAEDGWRSGRAMAHAILGGADAV